MQLNLTFLKHLEISAFAPHASLLPAPPPPTSGVCVFSLYVSLHEGQRLMLTSGCLPQLFLYLLILWMESVTEPKAPQLDWLVISWICGLHIPRTWVLIIFFLLDAGITILIWLDAKYFCIPLDMLWVYSRVLWGSSLVFLNVVLVSVRRD